MIAEPINWSKILEEEMKGAIIDAPINLNNYNKITEEDLKELKNSQKQKIVFTKPFLNYKIGDVLEIKVFPNRFQSEPPSFLVIDEKLGSPKYGFGGRGSTPFYELYKEKVDIVNETFIEKNKTNLLIAGAIVLGYFAYKKFKK